MRLPAFALTLPESIDEVVELLGRHGDDAAVLAGGQSLLLEMRYGSASPEVLVALDRVPGLDARRVRDGALHLGARVTHAAAAKADADGVGAGALGRLLETAGRYVAHPPVRTRGTFVGSLAWAHPSSEWCALALALGASLTLRGREGERTVPVEGWFRGPRRTVRRADEVIAEVALPLLAPASGIGFVEHRRSHASFALVAATAVVELGDDDRVVDARLALAGAAEVPLRAREAEAGLIGGPPDVVAAAARAAAAADPVGEPHCTADYRRHVVEVVARRALEAAVADARTRRRSQP